MYYMYFSCVLVGLNTTKVYSIDTHEVHNYNLQTRLSSLCLCNILSF